MDDRIEQLSSKQINRAKAIFNAAYKYGKEATLAALMTARAESSFLLFANDGSTKRADVLDWYRKKKIDYVPYMRRSMSGSYDVAAGTDWTTADSIGHFQQRPMYGYCDINRPEDLMNVDYSVKTFLTGSGRQVRYFLRSDMPKNLTLAQKCQWTQGSEFPDGKNYAPFEFLANQLWNKFTAEIGVDVGKATENLGQRTFLQKLLSGKKEA